MDSLPSVDAAQYRVIVRSIGDAGATMIPTLRRIRRQSDADLAALLYRAPSELVAGVARETAEKLCAVLATTGLDVAYAPDAEPFRAGVGDLEVSLVVVDPSRTTAVISRSPPGWSMT